MSSKILIHREDLSPYLFGSLAWSGIDWMTMGTRPADWLPLYRRVLGQGHYHLPFFLVLDLALLMTFGFEVRFRSEGRRSGLEGDETGRRRRMRYERECLGRLLQAPDVAAALEVVDTSPVRDACLERLLIQLLESLTRHYPALAELNPGLLRDFNPPNPGEADIASLHFALVGSGEDPFASALETFLTNLNEHVRWGHLLHEEDRFELAHLESLSTDHLRVGCRQIVEVARRLGSLQPLQLDLSAHEEGAETAFLDETHYPSGGLSGLTNRGSFENLVTSELAYLDEGTPEIGLFELRHVEGELLFYLRDSGNLRRKRRTIHFILDPGVAFDSKPLGYDYQYSVLLQGMCLRLLRDLFQVFEHDALRFEFHYLPTGGSPEILASEVGVMRTVLADDMKHDFVRFSTPDADEIDLTSFVDPQRKSYAIVFSGPERAEAWRAGLATMREGEVPLFAALVEIDSEKEESGAFEITLPRTGLALDALTRKKDAVLEKLVS